MRSSAGNPRARKEPSMPDPETRPSGAALPEARQRRTRWPGWVWLIPLVALGFPGWLVVEQRVIRPRPLTVPFSRVEEIKLRAPVRCKDVENAIASSMWMNKDLGGVNHVLATMPLNARPA